ncbi:uncharacterized protein LOC109251924 isoform X2 [Panthera pardus]|uniref:Uncharacterized protein LOC109251924 isoform X2 n=1 Tax=Panthera pardus TaxID=9691 RepID=A0A9V1EDJ7_PANPR|nr:uncharacterized protein LOC109251924 isoform X2 [Panthera pardus]XP_058559594.1 uncharacterized protein LOC131497389 isoform X2 [Neofelis nebulosa]
MSRGHADALRAGAARASRAAAAPLRTPDSASRRRPPALLAASSGPPLSGGIPNAGGPRPAPRRGGSAPPRTGADPEAGRTRGLHGPRLYPASRKIQWGQRRCWFANWPLDTVGKERPRKKQTSPDGFSLQQDSQIPREIGAIPPPPTERCKVIHPSWRKLQKPVHTEKTFRVQLPIDLSPGTDITCCTAFGKPCNISAPFPCLC